MIDSEQGTPTADPAGAGLEPAEDGRMWLDRRYRGALVASGLKEFDAVMGISEGRCLRALKDRENWRLELHHPHHTPRGAFLKKHHIRTWTSWLRARIGAEPGDTAGRVEARNVRRLTADGIAVMGLIAYGEQLHRNGRLESFVLTEELTGYTPLDHLLPKRFPPLSEYPQRRDRDLRTLVRQIAQIARRFHESGYNHRDLYCGHFFVKEGAPGSFDIKLIDLQRVQHRRHFRRRWIVKDLAQLAWSASREHIRCSDRMAFMREYLGVKKLSAADKRLIRAVLARLARMERKLGYGP
ncbi:MAG: hypothetical protein HUU20_15765 [Pirellulales bacterium]|nr:hypothetical protein [Pirellulales bacterium]